jgi:hypothetical protein
MSTVYTEETQMIGVKIYKLCDSAAGILKSGM